MTVFILLEEIKYIKTCDVQNLKATKQVSLQAKSKKIKKTF
jgi:hypothetical protein